MSTPTSPYANGSVLLSVDDTSPRLQYSGHWYQAGTEQDYLKTSHFSNVTGSFVKFTFNGTFITVYGSVDSHGSSSSYKLDDAPPVTTDVNQVPSTQYHWPFFFPPAQLEPGPHELTITVVGGTFNLDYLEYTSLAGEENVGDLSQLPTSALPTRSSVPSSLPDNSGSSSPSSNSLSAGAIAGIAIAAVVVVAAVAVALFYVRRRSARKVRHRSQLPEKGIDVLFDAPPKDPATESRSPFRRLSRIYRPTPAKSAQSSKTTSSSAPTSITQSSAMFTSVIMLSPALSVVSEESGPHDVSRRASGS
ncbi:hypothetical protein C8Q77DRAFT_1162014 [Trametes polyzona]|nr:hypothetical protein C8Q77DRAFT_1162014 [Trametes polyzona]